MQAPDELPLGVAGRLNAFLDDLPAAGLGVVEMSGFRKRARRVGLLHRAAFGAIVFVLRDGARAVFDLD